VAAGEGQALQEGCRDAVPGEEAAVRLGQEIDDRVEVRLRPEVEHSRQRPLGSHVGVEPVVDDGDAPGRRPDGRPSEPCYHLPIVTVAAHRLDPKLRLSEGHVHVFRSLTQSRRRTPGTGLPVVNLQFYLRSRAAASQTPALPAA
jgi:hypothetical protein